MIEITGATLGGSWKTPLALALATDLAGRGVRVALVAHGYGARARRDGRVVEVTSRASLEDVGDEALMVARALASRGNIPAVRVYVGPDRAAALRLAMSVAEVVICDGRVPDRAVPEAPHRILVVDAERPWGAGHCPPAGDTRADPDALLAHASQVVQIRDRFFTASTAATASTTSKVSGSSEASALSGVSEVSVAPVADSDPRLASALLLPFDLVFDALHDLPPVEPPGVLRDGSPSPRSQVRVVTACARPDRFVEALARRGFVVAHHVALPDHAGRAALALLRTELERCDRSLRTLPIVTTEKCATSLASAFAGHDVRVARLVIDPAAMHAVLRE